MRHNMRHLRHMSTSESVGAFFGFLTFELGVSQNCNVGIRIIDFRSGASRFPLGPD